MLKQGIHLKIVQECLGHAKIAVTLDTYSHISLSLQEAAAQKFDDLDLLNKKDRIASAKSYYLRK
jgi:integrase